MMTTSECIPWGGRVAANGYGHSGRDLAHRLAWERERGPIPPGYWLDHLCHNGAECPGGPTCQHRRCVNVDHLEPVTPQENTRRGNRYRDTCPYGHPYDGVGVDRTSVGGRHRRCLTCHREEERRRRARQRKSVPGNS